MGWWFSANKDKKLLHAAKTGRLSAIRSLLAIGAYVGYADKWGETALVKAASNGHSEVVKALLDDGASVDRRCRGGNTALHVAVYWQHYHVVKLLVSRGANLNATNNDGSTPLCHGLTNPFCDVGIAQILLDAGTDVTVPTNGGLTARDIAGKQGHPEIKLLIDTQNDNRLCIAARDGDLDIVRRLVHSGANINWKRAGLFTPLMCASSKGHRDIVLDLLAAGARVNDSGHDGNTALMLAAKEGFLGVARLLVDSGARVDTTNQDGYTARDLANESKRAAVVEFLGYYHGTVPESLKECSVVEMTRQDTVSSEQDVLDDDNSPVLDRSNSKSNGKRLSHESLKEHLGDGWLIHSCRIQAELQYFQDTKLLSAAKKGRVSDVRVLLANGACVGHVDRWGETALFKASANGHVAVVKELLDIGASMDRRCKGGNTALHTAMYWQHVHVVRLLITRGADLNATNNVFNPSFDGSTPLCHGLTHPFCDVGTVELLLDAGADTTLPTHGGLLARDLAMKHGHPEIEMLIAQQQENARLCFAARDGDVDTVHHLVCNGANVNFKRGVGSNYRQQMALIRPQGLFSPLMCAAAKGHGNIVRVLLTAGARVDDAGHEGNTALMVAAKGGFLEVVSMLIDAGATVHLTNEAGKSACEVANEFNHKAIIHLFLGGPQRAAAHSTVVTMSRKQPVICGQRTVDNGISPNTIFPIDKHCRMNDSLVRIGPDLIFALANSKRTLELLADHTFVCQLLDMSQNPQAPYEHDPRMRLVLMELRSEAPSSTNEVVLAAFGPTMLTQLFVHEGTKQFLCDPSFYTKMQEIQRDKSKLTEHMREDPRIGIALVVLVGGNADK
ncbi:Aste57867_18660 [Aphanomyces stellatus]|uniref:Aste57867_18660 protein n=1 Tax=Aphanomyces stellatus TaxID=120398 RepID=A0A485LCJ8_9STRA|nr:hypothetical protein As57867_018598 [Aphanomyces stellatus]VFT95395.1 Aste57867_18660 [Aphanomyces stellatus]